MSRYYILIVGVVSLILGVFIGKVFYEKEDIQISKVENIKDDKNLSINQNIIEERVVLKEELPIFIKEDLEYYSIDTSNLTNKDWQYFLKVIKENSLNELMLDDKHEQTLVHLAVRSGSLSMLRKLLDMGYDINSRDKYGNTPIIDAFASGNKEIINELIKRGADLYANYYDEKTDDVLTVALRQDYNQDLVKFLKNKGLTFSKKHFAELSKPFNKDYLIEHISSLDKNPQLFEDRSYFEQLILRNGDNDVIEYMLNNSVDFQKDNEGYNVLHSVPYNTKISLENVQKIIDSGLDINAPATKSFQTPLMHAVFAGDIEKTKLFLENKADTSRVDWLGKNVYDFLERSTKYKSEEDKEKVRKLLDSYK